jgi:hypothetical protein
MPVSSGATMTGAQVLAVWCASGALVGGILGIPRGRPLTGVVLGTFCGVFGWLIVLGAAPRHRTAAPTPDDAPVGTDVADAPVGTDVDTEVETDVNAAPQPDRHLAPVQCRLEVPKTEVPRIKVPYTMASDTMASDTMVSDPEPQDAVITGLGPTKPFVPHDDDRDRDADGTRRNGDGVPASVRMVRRAAKALGAAGAAAVLLGLASSRRTSRRRSAPEPEQP